MGLITVKRKDLFCHYLFAFRTACVSKATSLAQRVSFLSLFYLDFLQDHHLSLLMMRKTTGYFLFKQQIALEGKETKRS